MPRTVDLNSLVEALDLHGKHGSGVNDDPKLPVDEVRKLKENKYSLNAIQDITYPLLVADLDLMERFAEFGVVRQGDDAGNELQINEPFFRVDRVGDELRELRVALVQL
jgi:hypothetical protein